MELIEITDKAQWDALVQTSAFGHPLQLWGWGELKRTGGWWPYRVAVMDGSRLVAAAQILMLPIPGLLGRVAYSPRGPVMDPECAQAAEALVPITQFARAQRALFLTLEPAWQRFDWPKRWRKSREHVLMAETFTINLKLEEDQLLAAMRPKTRQYIRKADTDGVKIVQDKVGQYFEDFWRIYSDTAKRAKFGLHAKEYYAKLWAEMGENNLVIYALVDGKPEAFLWLACAGTVAFELYGGVTEKGALHKANYNLKWQAIQVTKAKGYLVYDFNGRLNDGVSQFKVGFGPKEMNYIGSFDLAFNPGRYALWHSVLPVAKQVGRRMRNLKTERKDKKTQKADLS